MHRLLDLYKKNQELVKYLFFGGLGFAISVLSFHFCRILGTSIALANVISWILAVLFMFVTNKRYVFQSTSSDKKKNVKEFALFITARLLTLFLETACILFFVEVIKSSELVAKCIGQVLVIVTNYLLSKFIIFNKKNSLQKDKIVRNCTRIARKIKDYFVRQRIPMIIAFVIWIFLNITGVQKLFFHEVSVPRTAFFKALHLVFLFIFFSIINYLIRKSKKDIRYKNLFCYGAVYFLILLVLLLLAWPGAWAWDDIGVLEKASYFDLSPWQHFFSGLFYVITAQTIPIPAGIILIQIIIVSLITGYVISFASHHICNKTNWSPKLVLLVLAIPFVAFPTIYYALTGFRMGIYQYLEILLFTLILTISSKRTKITSARYVAIMILTIVVGAWRSEGIVVAILVPILLLLTGRKYFNLKRVVVFFVITIIPILGIGKINNAMINNSNYSIGAIILPLVESLRTGQPISDEEAQTIDPVFDRSCMDSHPELSAELIFHRCLKESYTASDYSRFMKGSIIIIMKNFSISVKAIIDMFVRTTFGITEDQWSPRTCTSAVTAMQIYDDGNMTSAMWNAIDVRYKGALNPELRKNTIAFLAGTPVGKPVSLYEPILWNHILPILLCAVTLVRAAIRKKWLIAVICLSILCHAAIIAVASMAPYFMYYMPVYVSSYTIFIYAHLMLSRKHAITRK